MTASCPTCNSTKVRLVEEGFWKNFFVCENDNCQAYNKRFSSKTPAGHAARWAAPTAIVGSLLFGLPGDFGDGDDGMDA